MPIDKIDVTCGKRLESRKVMKSQSSKSFHLVITLVAVTLLSLRATAALAQQAESQVMRSEEHTSELQSHHDLVCRLLLEKKKKKKKRRNNTTYKAQTKL